MVVEVDVEVDVEEDVLVLVEVLVLVLVDVDVEVELDVVVVDEVVVHPSIFQISSQSVPLTPLKPDPPITSSRRNNPPLTCNLK